MAKVGTSVGSSISTDFQHSGTAFGFREKQAETLVPLAQLKGLPKTPDKREQVSIPSGLLDHVMQVSEQPGPVKGLSPVPGLIHSQLAAFQGA